MASLWKIVFSQKSVFPPVFRLALIFVMKVVQRRNVGVVRFIRGKNVGRI